MRFALRKRGLTGRIKAENWTVDVAGKFAPVRKVEVLDYDGNKYCHLRVPGIAQPVEVKAGYLYQRAGRVGEVPALTRRVLALLKNCSPS